MHKQSKRAKGKLVDVRYAHLRHGDRWGAPDGRRVTWIGRSAAAGTLVAALLLLCPSLAGAQPSPDPFRSQPATPSSPKPDPAPDPAPAPAAVNPPAATSVSPDAAQTSGSTAQAPPATPKTTTAPPSKPRSAPQAPRSEPIRRGGTPPRPVTHRFGEHAGRVLAAATSADGRPAALAGLALLLLALASGSLLHFLTRNEIPWRRA